MERDCYILIKIPQDMINVEEGIDAISGETPKVTGVFKVKGENANSNQY